LPQPFGIHSGEIVSRIGGPLPNQLLQLFLGQCDTAVVHSESTFDGSNRGGFVIEHAAIRDDNVNFPDRQSPITIPIPAAKSIIDNAQKVAAIVNHLWRSGWQCWQDDRQ
jgi:hypothetical protein